MRRSSLGFLVALLVAACAAPVDWTRYPVVPRPAELSPEDGSFLLDGDTRFVADPADAELVGLAEFLAEPLRAVSGLPLPMASEAGEGDIELVVDPALDLPAEGYRLRVRADGVALRASTHTGVFRGLQTLRQLLPPAVERGFGGEWRGGAPVLATARRPDSVVAALPEPGPDPERLAVPSSWRIPAVEIEDAPRFRYRGMHLDVGRHIFPPSFVKKYVDLLALYRFNTFHWHLTEDQGWRIEIEGYPTLTEMGAWRAETQVAKHNDPFLGDGAPYGGYYTRDEVRDIVAYARARHIRVIPEIEMPGHSRAALAAYPELACLEGPFEVGTRWGVYPEIYCPREETFAFLEDVLTEVMALFPSEYIHIGGDEAPKDTWEASAEVREIMARAGVEDEDALQSWFIRRIERFLNEHGRRLIGWDEILEGGLAPDATVMSWRGTEGGIEAARQGHDVVMTPNDDVYLDHLQGDPWYEPLAIGGLTTLEDVYAFEPVPAELGPDAARHVIGAQGNLWTEYLPTADHVEYMAFPRALALAEVAWSPRQDRDRDAFAARLPHHFARLDALDVHYRVPPPGGLRDSLTLDDSVTVRMDHPVPGTVIRYTTDGRPPSPASAAYEEPFTLQVDGDGRTVRAIAFPSASRPSAERTATFRRTSLRPADPVPAERLAPGLEAILVPVQDTLPELDALADATGVATTYENVGFTRHEPDGPMGFHYQGFMLAPRDGIYTFHLTSDDPSRLRIGDRTLARHDGALGIPTTDAQIALAEGWHAIQVDYADRGGRRLLRLEITGPTGHRSPIPAYRLRHLP